MTLVEILQGANVALRLIQARLITLIALLMTGGLYGWAMALQSRLGYIMAATWGLTVFLPILYIGRGGFDAAQRPQRAADESATRAPDGT